MKVEKMKKKELDEYCQRIGIKTKNEKKADLIQSVYDHERAIIDKAINEGNCLELLKSKIRALADEYASNLDEKIVARKEEMKQDDNSHYPDHEAVLPRFQREPACGIW